MLKTVAIVAVVLIAGVLVFAATKPDTFRVQRATSIKAPPETGQGRMEITEAAPSSWMVIVPGQGQS